MAKWRRSFLEKRCSTALAAGDISLASLCLYSLGRSYWSSGDWNTAEEIWVAGARVFIGDGHRGPLGEDSRCDEVVAELRERKILHCWPPGIVDADAQQSLYRNTWLLAGFVGAGQMASVFKIFGQAKAAKIYHDSDVIEQYGGEMRLYRSREEIAFFVRSEVRRFTEMREDGIAVPDIYSVDTGAGMYVRELIFGPTARQISRARFGLSPEERREAKERIAPFIDTVLRHELLVDSIVRKNMVFDLRRREWVLIDT